MLSPTPLSDLSPASQQIQSIRCGSLRLGFPYGWTRAVIDSVALTPLPNAPTWLVGAAYLNGQITPVVDLAEWLAEAASPSGEPLPAMPHLLLCGSGSTQLALCFSGLPQPLIWLDNAASPPSAPYEPPTQLAALVQAQLPCPEAPPCLVLEPNQLFETLVADLRAFCTLTAPRSAALA